MAEAQTHGRSSVPADRVAAVRRFNRLYTRQIGLLGDHFLDSPFSLTEARVLYELFRRDKLTASDIARELGIDHGYLSRILGRFSDQKLIVKTRAPADARQTLLSLTAKGRRAFAPLDRRSDDLVSAMLRDLSPDEQHRLVEAMRDIERVVAHESPARPSYRLRPHRPGDMGWVVARHGALYAQEYGWSPRIEALTADIVSEFLKAYDPASDRCWIAEIDDRQVGSAFVVRESDDTARLRLLIVEPQARGLGIGRRLVDECIHFARAAGYRKLTLWTHGVLTAARAIYQKAGFALVEQWEHDDFGKPEPSETWELTL